jgi:UDP-GlcNAc:undecaprenyl-phosphate GlcNAc-1-phosphate transferase
MLELILAATAALVLSGLLGRGAIAFAGRSGFLDRPGSEAHKQQARAVPYGGGAAVGLALLVVLLGAWAMGWIVPRSAAWPIAIGAVALFAVGLRDDWKAMPARAKLVAQAAVAAVVVPWAGLGLDSLKDMPLLAWGVAWLWLVLVTNAYNLVDHADGVSSSTAAISAGVMLSGCLLAGDLHAALLWASVIGALIGFLVWNVPPARLYLGDAGSMPLGFLVGCGTLSVTFWPQGSGGSQLSLLAPLLITAVPLFDTAVVVVKRLRRDRPIMQGDRNHISHRLGRLGLSPRATMAAVIALQIALAGSAIQLGRGDLIDGLLTLAQACAVLGVVVLLETTRDDGV